MIGHPHLHVGATPPADDPGRAEQTYGGAASALPGRCTTCGAVAAPPPARSRGVGRRQTGGAIRPWDGHHLDDGSRSIVRTSKLGAADVTRATPLDRAYQELPASLTGVPRSEIIAEMCSTVLRCAGLPGPSLGSARLWTSIELGRYRVSHLQ
jgi:hypothetical protein